jgi:2-polyprenyl-6-methoxyphenol hydroxylase-like FAD-dependent oxidoreductase
LVVAGGFDLVVVGGGLAGLSLGLVMAREGAAVVVVEREPRFRDRVRGEMVAPWGTAEARQLGLVELLGDRFGVGVPTFTTHAGGESYPLDLPAAAPHCERSVAFVHPLMQEGLLREAAAAGVTVLRPARVLALSVSKRPSVEVVVGGSTRTLVGRLLVGADGRESQIARLAGLDRRRDPPLLLSTGVLVEGEMDTGDAIHFLLGPAGCSAVVCPVAPDRYRLYSFRHVDTTSRRLSGDGDIEPLLVAMREAGVPAEWLADLRVAGPLATFDGAHRWIEHPYREGVVLVGDAAGASDPAWGSGLSRTLRDVRLLRDALLNDQDWTRAADGYAKQHNEFWARLRDIEHLYATTLMSPGEEGLARRTRTLELTQEIPEFENWTYGPEARCEPELQSQLLAPL